MNKCLKFEIYANDSVLGQSEIYKLLRDIQYAMRKACNKAMNMQYSEMLRSIENPKVKDKDIYGMTFRNYLYHFLKENISFVNTSNVSQTVQFITGKNNFDKSKLLKGEESLTTFKAGMPIILHNKSYKIIDDITNIYIETALFNKEKCKELGCQRITFKINNPSTYTKTIIYKILNGEYKQGSAQISYNENKKKWMMTVSFGFTPNIKELSDKRIMGIDLGITKVATMSVYDSEKGIYDRLNWKESTIDGKELIHYRQKKEARRKELSIASKWASDPKCGHGYAKRMEDVNAVGNKYERFRETYNHKISRYIVDTAIKYNCGVIQMEDLSGFSEAQEESLLKNWSYYDLQTKIKYKAEEKGITAILINPSYTSKRCSVCGCIHNDNRDCKKDQANFTCVRCGHHMNADVNASRNIALPNIENIIKEEMKKNETKN